MGQLMNDVLVLTNADVRAALAGSEMEVIDAVRAAYVRHAAGVTALPHSVFLQFPDRPRDRIIALPAYLGGDGEVAGVKWIASFPENVAVGLERASAVVILNSMETGRPQALIEGSLISARRTAASAALAARLLAVPSDAAGLVLVGCGVINFEVLRFLRAVHPVLAEVTAYDLDLARAQAFADRVRGQYPDMRVHAAADLAAALGSVTLVSIATTAATPYLDTVALLRPGTLVLHVSLRDVLPSGILAGVNVVDDADHVCRASTSLDLAERETGNRSFITASIGDIARNDTGGVRHPERATIFSPFGLGVLDLAVAGLVCKRADKAGLGTRIPGFLPGC